MWLFGKASKSVSNIDQKQWVDLTSDAQLDEITGLSADKTVVIFKHSTRCSISAMAKRRLRSDWNFTPDKVVLYYLDLIARRSLSNQIAERFNVQHESPQLIVLRAGQVLDHASHGGVSVDFIEHLISSNEH
jgi:bacillithiol system protein YtxJ